MRRSMKRVNVKKENKPFKTLAIATIAGLSIIGVGQAQATTLDDIDLSQKPINTPTLDYLRDKEVFLPQKTFQRDENGNIVKDSNDKPIIQEGTPILAPQSGYSLTKLEVNPDGSKPDGDNVITKFEVKEVTRYYDKTTGKLVANPISGTEYKVVQEKDLVPHYYNVNTVIPELNNSKVTWTEVTEEGNNTIKISSPNGTKYYKYTYNAPSNYDTTTNSNKTKDLGTITGSTGTYSNPGIYKGGAAINNPAGSSITIENYVFQNNKTTAYFESTTSNYKYVNLIGGAIYNEGEISKITSDFIGNSISATTSSEYVIDKELGGAICNNGTIGDITGRFIGNYAKSETGNAYGGAIYNYSTIGNIMGYFLGNTAYSEGGAIYNKGTIKDITGDFISNSVTGINEDSSGGAVYNVGLITNITGNFIGNYTHTIETSEYSYSSSSGAIENYGTIGNIRGNFIENYVNSKNAYGGAIYNGGIIYNIIGDFTGNYVNSNNINSWSGAIYNRGTIYNIIGNFIKNYTIGARNGAISNGGTIGNITGDFIGNYVNSSFEVYGGAIYNSGTIGNIMGDFIGNYVKSNSRAYGGSIYNSGTIGNITGDFIGNYAKSETGEAYGGAIYNDYEGTIVNIIGDFIGNYINSKDYNYAYAYGGAIYNGGDYHPKGQINNIIGDFIGNYAYAIANYSNSYSAAWGGAIYNAQDATIGTITGNFIRNYVEAASASGGAICNWGSIGTITGDFIGNYAKSENGEAKGGAIYSLSDLNLVADNRTNTFKDNYTEAKGIKDDNAIYVNWYSTLNFKMKNNGKFYMADNIDGTVRKDSDGNITDTYSVNIKGDDINNTTFYMLNDIRNANVTFDNTTINTVNNQTHVYNFNTLTVNSDTNFVADVDLANAEMDRISANTYGTHQGNLNVIGMNLLSDSTKDVTEIYFAEQGLKGNVVNGMPANGGYNLPSSAQTTFYTPIYKYNAIYDNRDDGGYFMFAKGDKILTPSGGGGITVTPTGNPSDAYNPAILSSSVASQAGANATMNQTFNYSFQNSDNFMSIPYLERVAIKTSNRYALSPTGDATDVGTFSQLFNAQNETSSAWVKPYASFENIPLKNGPKVSNITYGTLVGFDTPIKSIKHGWDRTWTGYIGYNGASQRFSGVDATQNGGLVGGTLTLYKGNFFNATTVSTGAIVGDNRTMYGTDNYTMLMAGVGNKTGYNFEFKEGKIIIQPSMLLSYTFVNTFDYTNAAGVRIKNDPLHAIQIAPGVKFIANTKNGWQPYIGVNMIWNLLDKSKVSADDVRLPEMSIKPYVQYGVGVQKRFKDRYMAFGQAMIQNGGRNGISLTAGFRWAIGKEGKPLEKVQRVNNKVSSVTPRAEVKVANNSTVQPERKIIKQLTPEQRVRLGARPQDTTRTTALGSLRQI